MSLTKNATTVQRFLSACFDSSVNWTICEVAISEFEWSLKIEHIQEEWEWLVQGDEATILFKAENDLCTFSIFAGNSPTAICAAIWAVQPLMRIPRWSWVRTLEEEEFTEA